MKYEDGETILFVGDSITDCGRGNLHAENQDLGDGYVSIIAIRLEAKYPERKVRILNSGVSGNRVTDLKLRWEDDVLAWKPAHLFIFIGINDVWRHFDAPGIVQQVSKEEYVSIYNELIRRSRDQLNLKSLGLISPYYLEANRLDPMRKLMDEYREEVKKLSQLHGTIYVDVQKKFDAFVDDHGWKCISDDRIHVNRRGHECIADCILKQVNERL